MVGFRDADDAAFISVSGGMLALILLVGCVLARGHLAWNRSDEG